MGEYGNIAAPSNIMCGGCRTGRTGRTGRAGIAACRCYIVCATGVVHSLFARLYTVPQHLADFFAIQQMAVGVAEFAPGDGSGFVK